MLVVSLAALAIAGLPPKSIALLPVQVPPPKVTELGGERTTPLEIPQVPSVVSGAFRDWAVKFAAAQVSDARSHLHVLDATVLQALRREHGVNTLVIPVVLEHDAFVHSRTRPMNDYEIAEVERQERLTATIRKGVPVTPREVSMKVTGYCTVLMAVVVEESGIRTLRHERRVEMGLSRRAERTHVERAVADLLRSLTKK